MLRESKSVTKHFDSLRFIIVSQIEVKIDDVIILNDPDLLDFYLFIYF